MARASRVVHRLPSWAAAIAPILVFVAVAVWMFWGTSGLGMEFDEVYRVNNLVAVLHPDAEPYNQAISSIEIAGVSIPLMYKEYVSSAFLISFLPLILFDDQVLGLRLLYFVFTLVPAILGFLLFRTRAYWVAVVVPLLALVSPLLYPDVTYGFVDVQHNIPLVLAAWSFREFRRGGRKRWLLLTAFLSGVAMNMSFYSSWIVAGLGFAVLVLRPQVFRPVLGVRNLIAAVGGLTAGAVNYVWYNITQGFPTVKPLVDRIFRPDLYAEQPIDFRESQGVLADARDRLLIVERLIGPDVGIFLVIFGIVAITTLVGYVTAVRRRTLSDHWLQFVPLAALVIAFMLIIVSPNTTRRGHYGMLVPLIEMSMVAAFVIAGRMLPGIGARIWRAIAVVLTVAMVGLFGMTSRAATDRVLRTGGDGFFSAAIFDLWDYVVEEEIRPTQILQVQWGSAAQFYFLSDGEFQSASVISAVLGASDEERVRIVQDGALALGGVVLVPVYTEVAPTAGVYVTELLNSVAEASDGEVCTLEVFTDLEGGEEIRLYRLDLSRDATPGDSSDWCG